MTPLLLFFVILLLSFAGFWRGKVRSVRAARVCDGPLHSLPVYWSLCGVMGGASGVFDRLGLVCI